MLIKNFDSYEELIKEIEKDKATNIPTHVRYPVRYILFNSFDIVRKFVQDFINLDLISITTYLKNNNGWLTVNDIVVNIKNLNKDSIIVLLSEFLRFEDKNGFFFTLKNLSEIEKNNLRFYIPIVGLMERFENEFINVFDRKKEWAPIWKYYLDDSEKINVYYLKFNVDNFNIFENYNFISDSKEWLENWKITKKNTTILTNSKILKFYGKNFLPDSIYNFYMLETPKDLINEVFNIEVNFEFKESEYSYWIELIENLQKSNVKTFTEFFLKYFNINDLNFFLKNKKEVILLYLDKSKKFDKWLLCKYFQDNDSYIGTIFRNLIDFTNLGLINRLWKDIFELENIKDSFYEERKETLKLIYEKRKLIINERELENKLNKLRNIKFDLLLKYLTNITKVELKKLITSLTPELLNQFSNKLLKEFPEIYYYLNWDSIIIEKEKWVKEYFKEYNLSKIVDEKRPYIEDILNIKNKSKSTFLEWFYNIDTYEFIDNTKYFWIDGLGAEWLPILLYFLEKFSKEKNYQIIKNNIVRINLPSITECNKYDFEKISDLDNFIHNNFYKYPDSLIEEIKILEDIVKNQILSEEHYRIGIISDHGFTFLCLKKFGNFKRLNFDKSNHYGRCMWIDNESYNDDEYFITFDGESGECLNKKSIIAIQHVSLYNTPTKEVHGGATPEEILVPFILLEKSEENILFNISQNRFIIKATDPIIKFKINPIPNFHVIVNKGKLEVIDNIYQVNLSGISPGDHIIELMIGEQKIEINVKIKGGMEEIDYF